MDLQLQALAKSFSQASNLEDLTRPLLRLLQAVTGLESTYLTRIDETARQQHILFSRNSGDLDIPEGLSVPWEDTLCKRALEERRFLTRDVPSHWGDSEAAAALGLKTYLSVPVYRNEGDLFGTLCGASSRAVAVDEEVSDVLELCAELIAHQIAREEQSQRSEERAMLAESALVESRLLTEVGELSLRGRSLDAVLHRVAKVFLQRGHWIVARAFSLSDRGGCEFLEEDEQSIDPLLERFVTRFNATPNGRAAAYSRLMMSVDNGHELAEGFQARGFVLPLTLGLITASSEERLEGGIVLMLDGGRALPETEAGLLRNVSQFLSLFASSLHSRHELEELNRQLTHHALHDPLTGLPNRRYLVEHLQRMMDQLQRKGGEVHVAFVDLDKFKQINDTHGHDVGDAFLQGMAERMRSVLRAGDLAARFGGDEFVVVAAGQSADQLALERERIYQRLSDAMQGRVEAGAVAIDYAGPSIGVVSWQANAYADADVLVAEADKAMYEDKQRRRSGFQAESKRV